MHGPPCVVRRSGTTQAFVATIWRGFPPAAFRFRTDTIAALDCFLTLGLLGVYLKVAMLGPQWDAIARFLDRRTAEDLGVVERLGFFANDLALNLIVIPAVATTVVCLVFRSYRVAAAFAISLAASVGYFVELRAGTEVGQYIAGDMLRDGAGWAIANPSSVADYITPASAAKLAALVMLLAAIVLDARQARRAQARGDQGGAVWRAAPAVLAIVVMGGAVILTPIAAAARLPGSALNASAVGRAAEALVEPVLARDERTADRGLNELLAASHRATRTAAVDPGHAFAGAERDSDLLVFMMETGPAQALDPAVEPGLPGAGRLLPRAFAAARHHTTHPYSSDALFSVLSGIYPSGRRAFLRAGAARTVNGLFSALPSSVVLRGVYLPGLYRIELDERMYEAFGASTLYVADRHPDDPLRAVAGRRAAALVQELEASGGRFDAAAREALRARLTADLQALERLKADIAAATTAGRRYAVMFFPQIGHAPWRALHGEATVMRRGRALMLLEDRWLAELVGAIEQAGRLSRTVIVVTADHGLRTRAEYPDLPVGVLSAPTFRVPALIYAPQALRAPRVIDVPTSHVDLAPTLLTLMGAPAAAARMEGVPIWQRRRGDRLYLLGAAYGGADGFVEGERYYMRQALSGGVYASDRLAFEAGRPLRPGDPLIPYVRGALDDAARLQHGIAIRLRDEPVSVLPAAASR